MNEYHSVLFQGVFLGMLYVTSIAILAEMWIKKENSWIVKVVRNASHKA